MKVYSFTAKMIDVAQLNRSPHPRYNTGRRFGAPKLRHPYHLVHASPWPCAAGGGALALVAGLARWIHGYGTHLLVFGIMSLGVCMIQWWKSVVREGTFVGAHTRKVENGLRLGILLFICSEIFFFVAFFWAYFHSALAPAPRIGSL